MIAIEMKVTAFVQEGYDVKEALSELMLDDDRVSYCDIDTVSERSTSKTFPEDDEGVYFDDEEDKNRNSLVDKDTPGAVQCRTCEIWFEKGAINSDGDCPDCAIFNDTADWPWNEQCYK